MHLHCVNATNKFKYLGHIIGKSSSDDSDINREIKALFTRTVVLRMRIKRCSLAVKARLFRTYFVCFYDTALWSDFTIGACNRFSSCYSKYVNYFSGTQSIVLLKMLFEFAFPSFSTSIHDCKVSFASSLSVSVCDINNCKTCFVS